MKVRISFWLLLIEENSNIVSEIIDHFSKLNSSPPYIPHITIAKCYIRKSELINLEDRIKGMLGAPCFEFVNPHIETSSGDLEITLNSSRYSEIIQSKEAKSLINQFDIELVEQPHLTLCYAFSKSIESLDIEIPKNFKTDSMRIVQTPERRNRLDRDFVLNWKII